MSLTQSKKCATEYFEKMSVELIEAFNLIKVAIEKMKSVTTEKQGVEFAEWFDDEFDKFKTIEENKNYYQKKGIDKNDTRKI